MGTFVWGGVCLYTIVKGGFESREKRLGDTLEEPGGSVESVGVHSDGTVEEVMRREAQGHEGASEGPVLELIEDVHVALFLRRVVAQRRQKPQQVRQKFHDPLKNETHVNN